MRQFLGLTYSIIAREYFFSDKIQKSTHSHSFFFTKYLFVNFRKHDVYFVKQLQHDMYIICVYLILVEKNSFLIRPWIDLKEWRFCDEKMM